MLTYGVIVKDEQDYLESLIPHLLEHKHPEHQVRVLVDTEQTPQAIITYLDDYPEVIVDEYRFQRDFAAMRNFFLERCETEWMFQIDCDEIPNPVLMSMIHEFLCGLDDTVEVVSNPRINTFSDMTHEYEQELYLELERNENGWYHWPDYQYRIVRCASSCQWDGVVHEGLQYSGECVHLQQHEDFSLLHHKGLEKQKRQTVFYETFDEHNELADFLLQRRKNFKEQLEQMRKRFYGDE